MSSWLGIKGINPVAVVSIACDGKAEDKEVLMVDEILKKRRINKLKMKENSCFCGRCGQMVICVYTGER